MTIEVLNRGFALAVTNEEEKLSLVIKVSENHMNELSRFIRFDALGFKNMTGQNFVTNAHKVSSQDGVVEAPHGKIFYTIKDGYVYFRPLNGSIGEFEFKASLDELAGVLIRETNQSRWDDYCVGQMGYNGRVVYFYTHLLLDSIITVTDRETFYIMLTEYDSGWKTSQSYITPEMWRSLAEKHRRGNQFLPPHDVPLPAEILAMMREMEFTSVKGIKDFFHVL